MAIPDDWATVEDYSNFLDIDATCLIAEARRRGMSREQLSARFRASLTANPDAAFEEFEKVPPGLLDPRVFDQTIWWVDMLRTPHRIADRLDFRDDHLLNVILYLRDNASRLRPPDVICVDQRNRQLTAGDWLARTPLMRALLDELEARQLNTE